LITDLTPARAPQNANDMMAGIMFQDGGPVDGGATEGGRPDGGADAGIREAGVRADIGVADTGAADGDAGLGSKWLAGIWFSGIYGIQFSASDSLQKGLDGIKQAFVQSPYLANY
jgi:hypothetical protein